MKSAGAWSRAGTDGAAGCGFEALPAGWYDRLDRAFEDLGKRAFFLAVGRNDDEHFRSACGLTENAFRSEIAFYSASEYAMENSLLQGGGRCFTATGTCRIVDGKVLLRPSGSGAASVETAFFLEDFGYGKLLACRSVDAKTLPGRPTGGGPAAYAAVLPDSPEACRIAGRWVEARNPGSEHEFTESSWLRYRDGKPVRSLKIKLSDQSLAPEEYFGTGPFPGKPATRRRNGTFLNAWDKATDTLESYAYVVDGDILRIIDSGATNRMTLKRKP